MRDAIATAAGEIPYATPLLADLDAVHDLAEDYGERGREMLSELLPQRNDAVGPITAGA